MQTRSAMSMLMSHYRIATNYPRRKWREREHFLGKAFVSFRSTGMSHQGRIMNALLIYFYSDGRQEKEVGKEQTLVGKSDQAQQCAGSRAKSFSIEKSEEDRSLTETLR